MTTWAEAAQTVADRWAKQGKPLAVPPDDPNEDDREFWLEVQKLVTATRESDDFYWLEGVRVAEALRDRLREDGPEDEPRDDHGRWTSGGGGDDTLASPEQEAALKDMTDENANSIVQGVLRSGSGAMDTPVSGGRTVGDDVRQIDSALAQSHTSEDTVVYRGAADMHVQPGTTVTDSGYVNTTTSLDTAFGHAQDAQLLSYNPDAGTSRPAAVYEIHVPAGANALALTDTEVLLPHDSVFSVISVEPGHVTMTYRGVAGG